MQMIQVTAALACAVPGARVLCGALEAGSYAELSTPWPENLPHTEAEAALYAIRERANLAQSQPLRRDQVPKHHDNAARTAAALSNIEQTCQKTAYTARA
jgi:hypothetical protein